MNALVVKRPELLNPPVIEWISVARSQAVAGEIEPHPLVIGHQSPVEAHLNTMEVGSDGDLSTDRSRVDGLLGPRAI